MFYVSEAGDDSGRVYVCEEGVDNNLCEVFARSKSESAGDNARRVAAALNCHAFHPYPEQPPWISEEDGYKRSETVLIQGETARHLAYLRSHLLDGDVWETCWETNDLDGVEFDMARVEGWWYLPQRANP